jgi:hypothetical protein
MPVKRQSPIAICLLAAMLGAVAAHAAFAQEQQSGGHRAAGSPPGEKDHGEGPKGEGPTAKGAKRPERPPDVTGIDTSITVQTRRPAGDHKTTISIGPKGLPPALAHRAPAGVTRNAIGVPVTSGGVTHGSNGGRPGLASPAQLPAPLPSVTRANQGVGGPKIATPNVQAPVTGLNRGSLSGNSPAHRGLALSGLGGPAKTATGINGTTIRRKQ